MPHGVACAFTMEAAIRLNAPHMGSRMLTFAEHCGFESVEAMVEEIRALKSAGGLPCTFAEAGITIAFPQRDVHLHEIKASA